MELHSLSAFKEEALSNLTAAHTGRMEHGSSQSTPKTDADLKELARQFESIFIQYMQKSMRSTVPKSGLFNSFSLEMYESMFDQELAGQVSLKKGIGLADVLYKDLKRMDETIRRNQEALAAAVPREKR
jgi:Rod binding domain-containing protein